jgi:hypothetical protein
MRSTRQMPVEDEDGVAHHSYRCSCKDLHVYHHECNKVNKPFMYVLSNVL